MKKVGLIAGEGILPVEFTRSAREQGVKTVVFALKGMASRDLEETADRVYWMDLDQYMKGVFLMMKERVNKLALLGKVKKEVIYRETDEKAWSDFFRSASDRKDYTLLKNLTDKLAKVGIEVIDPTRFLTHLLPEKENSSGDIGDTDTREDIEFGYDIAKKMAGMDIGQVVIVKKKAVVAIEAMEGTDAVIERSHAVAGPGCVMIKVSRPHQDMRWDIPTVGPRTMEKLTENKFNAIAVESGKMYILEKEKFFGMAADAGIAIKVL